MSPEDRDAITTSIANLWTFNAVLTTQILRGLRDEGAMSAAAIERTLQRTDAMVEAIDGELDQRFATGMLATVRTMLQDD